MAAGDTTAGKRLYPTRVDVDGAEWFRPEPGGYWFEQKTSHWSAMTPTHELRGSLQNHDVVEHEDGTITVSPSILVDDGTGHVWHGYLERGVWREV